MLHQINGLKCVILRSKGSEAAKATKNLVLTAKNGMLRSAQHDKHFWMWKSVNLFPPENEPSHVFLPKIIPDFQGKEKGAKRALPLPSTPWAFVCYVVASSGKAKVIEVP